MKKKVIIVLLCLSVTLLTVGVIYGEDLLNIFFRDSESVKVVSDAGLIKSGESKKIDEYTITLERCLFEEKTKIGYFVFSIKTKKGKVDADINKFKQTSGSRFGTNNRFAFLKNGSQYETFEYSGDVLYEYISLRYNEDDFDNQMTLLDRDTDKRYSFAIPSKDKYREFLANDGEELYISPLGIVVESSKKIKVNNLLLELEKGNQMIVEKASETDLVKWHGAHSSVGGGLKQYRVQYVFKKAIDIDQIKGIIFNGKECKKIK